MVMALIPSYTSLSLSRTPGSITSSCHLPIPIPTDAVNLISAICFFFSLPLEISIISFFALELWSARRNFKFVDYLCVAVY
uniref:Uncharacterized protein n=1 Tax=Anguilla anguilla TaxID=7936 RepID=A0A0E9RHD0_ANGAN